MRRKMCWFLIPLLLAGCGRTYYRSYYTLDYTPRIPRDMRSAVPLHYRIEVGDFEISPTYDRSGIVIRDSMHRMRYSRSHLWPVRPQEAVRDLLLRHFRDSRVFAEVKTEFLDVRPDFTVLGNVHCIELYSFEGLNRAGVEVELSLQENRNETIVVAHHFRRLEKTGTDDMAFFAMTVSDILHEEHNRFIGKVLKYFEEMENETE